MSQSKYKVYHQNDEVRTAHRIKERQVFDDYSDLESHDFKRLDVKEILNQLQEETQNSD